MCSAFCYSLYEVTEEGLRSLQSYMGNQTPKFQGRTAQWKLSSDNTLHNL